MQRRVIIGRVSGVYGVRGWIKIYSFTTPIDNIFRYLPWELRLPNSHDLLQVTVTSAQRYGKSCLAELDSYRDRNAVLGLVGADILIDRGQLPSVGEKEYYWADLSGCRVMTRDGLDLGCVSRLIETGANDVLVVMGERERLIPFLLKDVILSVDSVGRMIYVDWDQDF